MFLLFYTELSSTSRRFWMIAVLISLALGGAGGRGPAGRRVYQSQIKDLGLEEDYSKAIFCENLGC